MSLQWSRDLSVAETSRDDSGRFRGRGPSMEPRPFSRGNQSPCSPGRLSRWAFNGAATFQSRKLEYRRSRGQVSRPFNGAATFQSRKLRLKNRRSRTPCPLQWSRDLSVAETSCWPRRPSGASPLQWSRDLSVAETTVHPSVLSQVTAPSMEPRPFSRGNRKARPPKIHSQHPSMEPRPFSRGNSGSVGAAEQIRQKNLQWSRDLSVAETGILASSASIHQADDAFNGAATFQSRKRDPLHRCNLPSAQAASFNGAATFQSRKPP